MVESQFERMAGWCGRVLAADWYSRLLGESTTASDSGEQGSRDEMIWRLLILLAVVFGCLLAAIIYFQPSDPNDSDLVSVKVTEGELLQDSLLASMSPDQIDGAPGDNPPPDKGKMVALPAPPRQPKLSAVLQKELWDQEHVAFELETRLGRLLKDALVSRDAQRIQQLFQNTERLRVPRDAGRVVKGPFWESRRWSVSSLGGNLRDVSVAELAQYLIGYIEDFATIDNINLRVLSLRRVDIQTRSDTWWVHLGIAGTGKLKSGGPTSFDSEHIATCRFANEAELTDGKLFIKWSIRKQEQRQATQVLMRERTRQSGLADVVLRDNWNAEWHPVRPHAFQTAVEDWNRDGTLEIAISSLDGPQYLLQRDASGRFIDVAEQYGLPAERGNGVAVLANWFDYDNDGFPDLLLGDALYHNEAGARFVDVTEESGLVFDSLSMGVQAADYNGDGLPDLYVLNYGDRRASSGQIGYVDDTMSGAENQLWQNLGNGRFLDVSQQAGVDGGRQHSFAAAWLYANEDEYPDLYVANEFGQNNLFLNDGKGSFQDRAEFASVAVYSASRGVVAGDLNGDTAADLYVANMYARSGRRIIDRIGRAEYPPGLFGQLQGACIGNRLYRRVPNGPGYNDVTQGLGVNQVGWAYAPAMADFDGDGSLDLYAATGHLSFDRTQADGATCFWRNAAIHPTNRAARLKPLGTLDQEAGEFWVENPRLLPEQKRNLSAFEPNRMFFNAGKAGFVDLTHECGAGIDADSRSSIVGDFDGDGAPDLLVASVGGGPLRLFLNEIPTETHRVRIALKGVQGNRLGLGARVIVRCGEQRIARDVFPQNGFMGQCPLELLIGVGDATEIDELTVRWQGGKLQRHVKLPVDCQLTITEGEVDWKQRPFDR